MLGADAPGHKHSRHGQALGNVVQAYGQRDQQALQDKTRAIAATTFGILLLAGDDFCCKLLLACLPGGGNVMQVDMADLETLMPQMLLQRRINSLDSHPAQLGDCRLCALSAKMDSCVECNACLDCHLAVNNAEK